MLLDCKCVGETLSETGMKSLKASFTLFTLEDLWSSNICKIETHFSSGKTVTLKKEKMWQDFPGHHTTCLGGHRNIWLEMNQYVTFSFQPTKKKTHWPKKFLFWHRTFPLQVWCSMWKHKVLIHMQTMYNIFMGFFLDLLSDLLFLLIMSLRKDWHIINKVYLHYLDCTRLLINQCWLLMFFKTINETINNGSLSNCFKSPADVLQCLISILSPNFLQCCFLFRPQILISVHQ